MGSKVGQILKTVAPLALSYAFPGVGTALGTALGASGATAAGIGNALIGGATGALTGGGLKGGLIGAATGGLGGYAGAGGFDGTIVGDTLGSLKSGVSKFGDFLGLGSGTSSGGTSTVALPQNGSTMAPGTGGLASGGSAAGNSTMTNPQIGATGGGMSSYILPALGAVNSLYTNSQAQKQLKTATNQANAALSPYMTAGGAATTKMSDFLGLGDNPATAEDILAASPGYKFQLDQGTQALDRSQASRGGYFSGAALKAAQDYSSGLAKQTADDYYAKLAGASGQGLNAAGAYGNNVTAMGSAGANANIQSGNTLSQLLAGMTKRIIGIGSDGKPIYA